MTRVCVCVCVCFVCVFFLYTYGGVLSRGFSLMINPKPYTLKPTPPQPQTLTKPVLSGRSRDRQRYFFVYDILLF